MSSGGLRRPMDRGSPKRSETRRHTMASKSTVNKVATVIVPIADQDKALEFYCGTLGFEPRVDIPFGGQYRWIEVGLPGQDTTIAIAPPRGGEPNGNRATGLSLHTDDIDGDP